MPLSVRDIYAEQITAFLPSILNGRVEPDLPQSSPDIAHSTLPGIEAVTVQGGGA